MLRFDHLVIAARELAPAIAWAETRLGAPPAGRGRHATMGTHNALWGLGDGYLEVIAPDPDGLRPDRPRWFGFDDPETWAALADGPRLVTWAAATDDLPGLLAAAPIPLGAPMALSRDDLAWEVAMTEAAALPLGGAWPLLIHWTAGLHPARRLGSQGLGLQALEIAGEGAAPAAAALAGLDDPRLRFLPGAGPTRLSARLATPAGPVTL